MRKGGRVRERACEREREREGYTEERRERKGRKRVRLAEADM